jgi:hypothetical protein
MQLIETKYGAEPEVTIDRDITPIESQPDIFAHTAWTSLKNYLYEPREIGPEEQYN